MNFDRFIFATAIESGNYTTQRNGNIAMSIRLTTPIVDASGHIHAGLGFDKNAGWLPTMRAKLIVGPDCKETITSFPGQ